MCDWVGGISTSCRMISLKILCDPYSKFVLQIVAKLWKDYVIFSIGIKPSHRDQIDQIHEFCGFLAESTSRFLWWEPPAGVYLMVFTTCRTILVWRSCQIIICGPVVFKWWREFVILAWDVASHQEDRKRHWLFEMCVPLLYIANWWRKSVGIQLSHWEDDRIDRKRDWWSSKPFTADENVAFSSGVDLGPKYDYDHKFQ